MKWLNKRSQRIITTSKSVNEYRRSEEPYKASDHSEEPYRDEYSERSFDEGLLAKLQKSLSSTVFDSDSEEEDDGDSSESQSDLQSGASKSEDGAETTQSSSSTTVTNNFSTDSLSSSQVRATITQYRRKNESLLRKMHIDACKNLQTNRIKAALEIFEDILCLLVSEYGDKHKRVGSALHNLAIAHFRAGNLEDAEDSIEEAIVIRRKKLREHSPKLADSLVELGIIFLAQKKYEESLEVFKATLAERRDLLTHVDQRAEGQTKIQISKILNNIGCADFEYGEGRLAKEAFEEALAIQTKSLGETSFGSTPGYLTVSNTFCNLGFAHMDRGEFERAIFMLEEALKIQQNVLEHSNVIIMSTIENLAYACVKEGLFYKARKYYLNMLDIIGCSHDKYDLRVADVFRWKAFCEIMLFEYQEALHSLEKVETVLDNNMDKISCEYTDEIDDVIGAIHVRMVKFKGLTESLTRSVTKNLYGNWWDNELLCKCGFDIENDGEVDLKIIKPTAPTMIARNSGHRISYA